ncbi:unnamed protein product [marine sediment metagenome]|uniref:Uncharacterized protein n=1 Tax=marine sediment metagenome TaxID=412755 RepID=X1LGX3_9ZZZZ
MQRLTGLNLVPKPGRMEPDINPCTRKDIKLYKETLTLGDPLTADELEIFKAQFKTLLAGPGSEERRIQLDRINAYVTGLRCIKYELGNMAFTGMNPEDTELGFGHIRPVFTYDPLLAAATCRILWTQPVTTAYADYVADSAAGGTPQVLGNSFGLIITHVMSLLTPTPFITEMQFTAGRTGILIPIDTRALVIADNVNGVAMLPVPTVICKPKSTLRIKVRGNYAKTAELALRGLVVGLGRAIKATTTYPAV